MIAVQNHIVVRVNLDQNSESIIGGNKMKTGRIYNENFREKNPVVAEIVEGLGELKTGLFIVCNYNYFEEDSPLLLTDNLYSIPVNEEIFAIVRKDGALKPVCGNVLVERIMKQTATTIPYELKKPHINQGVVSASNEGFYKGQHIFWLPFSDYEIVYHWEGHERRAVKVHKTEITGYLKKL